MQPWSYPLIEKRKAAIKAELDRIADQTNSDLRLKTIVDRIRILGEEATPQSARDRYVYVVSALVHHLRHGGLTSREVRGLEELAFAILESQGIQSGTSRVSFLFGEIHAVKSQLAQKSGDFWEAAWETQIARRLARPDSKQLGFQYMAAGLRCLRTGNLNLAMRYFKDADENLHASEPALRNRLGWLQALRLRGDYDRAIAIEQEIEGWDMSPRFRAEFAWEKVCRQVSKDNNPRLLLQMTRKGKEFDAGAYALEAKLWGFAHREKKILDGTYKVKTLARRGAVPKALVTCTAVLEECYDTDFALSHRLRRIVEIRDMVQRLATLDKEMLVWLGIARWLERSKSVDLAQMAFDEYRTLSLRVSDGAREDALGLGSDLWERLIPETSHPSQ